MTIRKAHGAGASAMLRVETPPVDELPLGVQAQPQGSARHERRANGQFQKGSRTIQSAGGKATKGKTKLAAKLGLSTLPDNSAFAPYKRAAVTFRRVHCADLARTVGGGVCGPGPSSIVATAARALAWSLYLSDRAAETDNPELAIQSITIGDKARQALLTAHGLCAKEAEARARANPRDVFSEIKHAAEKRGGS